MAQGGKTLNDRKLSASVRTKALEDILVVLTNNEPPPGWSPYKLQMLMSLSKTVLPRLNEHTGEDGGAIEFKDMTNKSDAELAAIIGEN